MNALETKIQAIKQAVKNIDLDLRHNRNYRYSKVTKKDWAQFVAMPFADVMMSVVPCLREGDKCDSLVKEIIAQSTQDETVKADKLGHDAELGEFIVTVPASELFLALAMPEADPEPEVSMTTIRFHQQSYLTRITSTWVDLSGNAYQITKPIFEMVEIEIDTDTIQAKDLRNIGITIGTMNFDDDAPKADDYYAVVPGFGEMSVQEAIALIKSGQYKGYTPSFKIADVNNDYVFAYVDVMQSKANHLKVVDRNLYEDYAGNRYVVDRQAVYSNHQVVPASRKFVKFDGYWSVAVYTLESGMIIAEAIETHLVREEISGEVGIE